MTGPQKVLKHIPSAAAQAMRGQLIASSRQQILRELRYLHKNLSKAEFNQAIANIIEEAKQP